MRLLSFMQHGELRPGALVRDQVVDLGALQAGSDGGSAFRTVRELIEGGPELWSHVTAALAGPDALRFARPLAGVELAAPIPDPPRVLAVGQNYADKVRESGAAMPTCPVLLAKLPTSVIGPGAAIRWDPDLTSKVIWEVELAVVIGRKAHRVSAAEADDYIFGYTIGNDVTARDLLEIDRQTVRGKSLDTFCPLGPWIVTKDELPAPGSLRIACRIGDEYVQDSCTDQLIFGIPYLIEYFSRSITMLPGDVLLTGTPAGVGPFPRPPRYLHDGDVVTLEIEGIGALTNPCRTE